MPSLQLGASLLDLFAVRVTARGITVGPVCVVITARGIDVGPVCRHYSPGINVFTCLPSGLLLGALISSCFLSLFFFKFYFVVVVCLFCFDQFAVTTTRGISAGPVCRQYSSGVTVD